MAFEQSWMLKALGSTTYSHVLAMESFVRQNHKPGFERFLTMMAMAFLHTRVRRLSFAG